MSPIPALLDLRAQFDRVTEYWSPKVVAQVNDQYVKVAKVKGDLAWHDHAGEDELFWIIQGRFRLEFRDGAIELGPGEMCVVPRGKEHHPVAEEECWMVIIEPVSTKHTGDVVTPQTRSIEEQLR